MKKLNHLISTIRDSKFLGLNLKFEESVSNIELSLMKDEKLFLISLKGIQQILIYEDTIQQEYIGQIKGIKDNENNYKISLDPYDERIEEIVEQDNYVFKFTDFEIV